MFTRFHAHLAVLMLSTAACFCSGVPEAAAAPIIAEEFVHPPDDARPWVYWFWKNGNIRREGISADLEAMAQQGIGGVILMEVSLSVPPGPVKFFDDQWRDLLRFAASEADRLGLKMDLNSGPGWTGSGGAWVTPEQSMKKVVASETQATGPSHFDNKLEQPETVCDLYHDIAVLAFPAPANAYRITSIEEKALYKRGAFSSQPGVRPAFPGVADYGTSPPDSTIPSARIVELTQQMDADGKLVWDVPEGHWTILRFGYTSTGQTNRPAPLPGLECDKMDPAALDAHFDHFITSMLKDLGPLAGKVMVAMHLDSWEVGAQNWTARFREEFQRRRGYDLLRFLPVMLGKPVDNLEMSERFLWDLRQTASDIIVEYHGKRMQELASKSGLWLSIEPYDMMPCDDMTFGATADVPMCEFWSNVFDSRYSVTEAASIAHVYGKPLVAAEAFTSIDRWLLHPGAIKANGDWAFSEGVNRMVIHRYIHQPFMQIRPGLSLGPHGLHYERTQTWWEYSRPWHEYLARCQYALQRGHAVADVLYLNPEGAPNVFQRPQPAPEGYKYDACTPEALKTRVRGENGLMRLPDGAQYRLLVLPRSQTMTPELLETVKSLALAGVPIIGAPPHESPSLSGYPACDERVRELAKELWSGHGAVILDETPAPAKAEDDGLGQARWIWANEGQPQIAASTGRRLFRRVIDVAEGLRSATVWMTADNSFQLVVNGERTSDGGNFNQLYCSDIAAKLKPGLNNLVVVASNSDTQPNPAGLIGSIVLRYADGHTQIVATDKQWRVVPRVREFDPETADANAGDESLELGPLGMMPWATPEKATPRTANYPDSDRIVVLLEKLKVLPDFESEAPLRFAHRQDEGRDVYFVSNAEGHTIETLCTFRVTGKTPQLWHPETGRIRPFPEFASQPDGRTAVPLRFEPAESYFVVFSEEKTKTPGTNFQEYRSIMPLSGPWTVSFDPKWGGPAAPVVFTTLDDWAQRPEKEIQYYSGAATYTTTFDLPAEILNSKAPPYIDLGHVEIMASVTLNGKKLGIVWKDPYRIDLAGAAKAGTNTLEVTVVNLWPNRLIGDEQLPPDSERKEDGTLKQWPDWLLEGKSSPTGRYTFATWRHWKKDDTLLPSGLLGPVEILQEQSVQAHRAIGRK